MVKEEFDEQRTYELDESNYIVWTLMEIDRPIIVSLMEHNGTWKQFLKSVHYII